MLGNLSERQKLIVLILVLLFLAIIFFSVFSVIQRAGKIKVTVEIIPEDAKIYIDNKKAGKTAYLKKGKYKFRVSKEGFRDASSTVNITRSNSKVILIPEAVSTDAKRWLSNNPGIQKKIEALSSEAAGMRGVLFKKDNPLVGLLPYSDLSGPFTIDYALSTDNNNKTALIISNSTPLGRAAALDWIRQQGYSPTDFKIQYEDFKNPLLPKGE